MNLKILVYLAGIHGSHINNVKYLFDKAGLRSRDVRQILSNLTNDERSRYDYARLDELYLQYTNMNKGNLDDINKLKKVISRKTVLVIAPGKTVNTQIDKISQYISSKKPIVISINFIPDYIDTDFIFFNNPKRYDFLNTGCKLDRRKIILTTNVKTDDDCIIIPVNLIMKGNTDNSAILLLYMLDILEAEHIALAGFDGSTKKDSNYVSDELSKVYTNYSERNIVIEKGFKEFVNHKTCSTVSFVTNSIFEHILDK